MIDSGTVQTILTRQDAFEYLVPHRFIARTIRRVEDTMKVGRGKATIQLPGGTIINIPSAIYTEDVTTNLLSFQDLQSFQYRLLTDLTTMDVIRIATNTTIESFPKSPDGLYRVKYTVPPSNKLHGVYFTQSLDEYMLRWHIRMGHPSVSTMKHILRNRSVLGIGTALEDWKTNELDCPDCRMGKVIRKPFKTKQIRQMLPNERLHVDTKGPIKPSSGEYNYFLVIVDEGTRKGYVHLLKSREESYAQILLTIQKLRTQHPQFPVKSVRLDNAAEFKSKRFTGWCESQGIELQYSVPHVHEQNGLAENYIKRISHMARTLLLGCNLPPTMWQHAVRHAGYLSGFWAHSALHFATPNEVATGLPPDASHLRTFGCSVYIPVVPTIKSFVGPHRQMGIYIGCQSPSIILWLHPHTGLVSAARFADCSFDENTFPQINLPQRSSSTPTAIPLTADQHINNVLQNLQIITPSPPLPKASSEQKRQKKMAHSSTPLETSGGGNESGKQVTKAIRKTMKRPKGVPGQDRARPDDRSSQGESRDGLETPETDLCRALREVGGPLPSVTKAGESPPAQGEPKRPIDEATSMEGQATHPEDHEMEAHGKETNTAPGNVEAPRDVLSAQDETTIWEMYHFMIDLLEPIAGDRDLPTFAEVYSAVETAIAEEDEKIPTSLAEALKSPKAKEWWKATEVEWDALTRREVFEGPMEVPQGRKKVDGKWIYDIKRNARGEIARYKARLVARGCTQRKGIDYNETFAPVVDLITFRILIAFALHYGLHIESMDVVTAYLYGDIDVEIYMEIPEGIPVPPGMKNPGFRLKKSLYGLKQSGKTWYETLTKFLRSRGFQNFRMSPCVFVRRNGNELSIIVVYVDDLNIIGTTNAIAEVKAELKSRFEMKDLGPMKFTLGMQFEYLEKGIFLYQSTYIERLIKRFKMENCNGTNRPLRPRCLEVGKDPYGPTIPKKDKPLKPGTPFRELVGALLYLSTTSRPDIAFPTSLLARYGHDPCERHWEGAKMILKYLKRTIGYGLFYQKSKDFNLVGFADAGYLSDMTRSRSQTGYVFTTMGAAVAWRSSKQSISATSTSNAELIALFEASKECVWIRRFLSTLHEACRLDFNPSPTIIYEDNSTTIHQVKTGFIKTEITKHISPKFWWTHDIDGVDINTTKIDTKNNTADIFTKVMTEDNLEKHRIGLGLYDLETIKESNGQE